MTNTNGKYTFPFYNTPTKIPYGQYKISICSEFGETVDSIVTLNSDNQKVTFHINWKYQFDDFSEKVFESNADSISIRYEYKYCCGGISCSMQDAMELYKTSNGQYRIFYHDSIFNGNSLDTRNDKSKEKTLELKKTAVIENYFKKNNIPYNPRKIIECKVIIGRHVYAMKAGSYTSFKQELLN